MPSAARARQVLALLAADLGRQVSLDAMVRKLWDGTTPGSSTGTVQTYVKQLRHALAAALAPAEGTVPKELLSPPSRRVCTPSGSCACTAAAAPAHGFCCLLAGGLTLRFTGLGSRRAGKDAAGIWFRDPPAGRSPDLRHRSTHALWEPPCQSPHVLYSAASSTADPRWMSSGSTTPKAASSTTGRP
ncbi:AfsR/SARP family transcriptional regulator [Streptomyces longispororuber]|uniref:AfsR/SARP family transcriptional regulator n=1 Tax=Streptomyces longispororuber TaxID=68230 RepID=UPI0035AC1456